MPATVHVLRADDREERSVLAELRLDFLADVNDIDRTELPPDLEDATRRFVDEEHAAGQMLSWLARDEDDGAVVGCVSLLTFRRPPVLTESRQLEGYVIHMYVPKPHRRRGIARLLFETVLAASAELGLRKVSLHATDDGRPLYEEYGFETPSGHLALDLP